jgi:hypothetical protein
MIDHDREDDEPFNLEEALQRALAATPALALDSSYKTKNLSTFRYDEVPQLTIANMVERKNMNADATLFINARPDIICLCKIIQQQQEEIFKLKNKL